MYVSIHIHVCVYVCIYTCLLPWLTNPFLPENVPQWGGVGLNSYDHPVRNTALAVADWPMSEPLTPCWANQIL